MQRQQTADPDQQQTHRAKGLKLNVGLSKRRRE